MKTRSIALRLQDMIDAISEIRQIVGDLRLESFEADVRTRWSVERGLEIISEASRHLDESLKQRNESVSGEIVWSLTQTDLDDLERVCREELGALGPKRE